MDSGLKNIKKGCHNNFYNLIIVAVSQASLQYAMGENMELKIDEDLNVQVLLNTANKTIIKQKAVTSTTTDSTAAVEGGTDMGGDAYGEVPMDATGSGVKDPLLSNWIFVIGITVVTLAISITVGILLAKRRIKRGIELYED